MGSIRRYIDFYLTQMRLAVIQQFQYPVANYFYMIGMIAEPVIYLVVWSTVAVQQGGSVGGYTPATFAAYYLVWILVRNMNIVLTPYAWEMFIQRGYLSMELLRPIHPLHGQLAYFSGWKFVVIVLWIPLAIFLSLFFKPSLDPQPWQVLLFFFALWGGFLVRFMWLWLLGMITFWTTRVSAIFELYFTVELLFSGRLVPLSLMPEWAQQVSSYLPFKWAFGYPIEQVLGILTLQESLAGLGMQLFWILLGLILVRLTWRAAMKKYSAVGA